MSIPPAPIGSRQPLDLAAAGIPFRDPEAAKAHLQHVDSQISPTLAAALPGLLTDTPDPDSAVLLFDRLISNASGEVLRVLERHNVLAHYAIVVFGHSRYLAETLLQNSDLLQGLIREKSLDRTFSREEFRERLARFQSRSFQADISLLLAHFKRREYVRIMLRDLLNIAPMAETTAELSALSDVLIEDALHVAERELQERHGSPQHLDSHGRLRSTSFAILSLGKLGANELNYNSDIDLLYLYGDGPEPTDAEISNHEYFVRLAQKVTDVLSRITPQGAVFRIDLRLRPQGTQGELAVSLQHALNYYSEVAQDWERQALIKARYSAGDVQLARNFLSGVHPHVYTPQVNFSAIKTALVARERAQTAHRSRNTAASIDVKIDPGGIRDIEFLVQCLQRVYGGAESWLRSGGTLFSLQKLHDKRHITGKEFHDLSTAYDFLRHVEHRLQLRYGQQTHRLPDSTADLEILRRSLANVMPAGESSGDIVGTIRSRMAAVAEIYNRIVYQREGRRQEAAAEAGFQLRTASLPEGNDRSNQQVLERLAGDAPTIYAIANRQDLGPEARRNLFRFLSSAFTSSERYAAVLRHAAAVDQALVLFESSDYLTDILVRYPDEIATLAPLGDAARSVGAPLFGDHFSAPRAIDPVFAYIAGSPASYSEKLAVLRQHYRHREFASAARDVLEFRPVYESLSSNSAAADDAIAAALSLAGEPSGFTILALGRLGTNEFDLLSDADLLFVSNHSRNREDLTRAAEQVMNCLAAYTREGMLFPVDTRLRPHGTQGELVATRKQLGTYFDQEAQPWEALMYSKVRYVAGDQDLAREIASATDCLFGRFARDPAFAGAVRNMRAKLEPAGETNLKTSPGGIYDIDFLVSYLLLVHSGPKKAGTIRDRLWRCAAGGHLTNSDAAALDHAAEFLRTLEHVVRIVTGRARKWLPATQHAREVTERLMGKILGRSFSEGIERELLDTMRLVREIYARVLA